MILMTFNITRLSTHFIWRRLSRKEKKAYWMYATISDYALCSEIFLFILIGLTAI